MPLPDLGSRESARCLCPPVARNSESRVRRFVLLLRYTGLCIGDVVGLRAKNIGDGKVVKVTAKTGTTVVIPMPEAVAREVEPVPGRDFPLRSDRA